MSGKGHGYGFGVGYYKSGTGGGASGWLPTDLNGIYAWYKPEDLPASGAISTWVDSSGNGYDATMATPSQQPQVGATLDGIKGADFDGGDWLQTSSAGAGVNPVQVWVVVVPVNASAKEFIVDSSGSTTRAAMYSFQDKWYAYSGAEYFVATPPTSTDPWYLGVWFNGADSSYYHNSATETNGGNNTGTQRLQNLRIGAKQTTSAGENWNGLIYEIVITAATNTTEERAALATYMDGRYPSINIAIP